MKCSEFSAHIFIDLVRINHVSGDFAWRLLFTLLFSGNPGLGLQLSLADFGSEAQPPTWLARDVWENIMALSVLPGPLDNLCVKIAEDSDGWYKWFCSETPEKTFNLVQQSSQQVDNMTTSDENGNIDSNWPLHAFSLAEIC